MIEKKSNSRLIITEDGKLLYNEAIFILQQVDGLFNYLSTKNLNQKNDTIKIAMHHTAINYLAPKFIKKFREFDKETKIIIYNLNKIEALEKLKKDEVDIVFHIIDSHTSNNFFSKKLFSFAPTILMHKNNKLANKKGSEITFKDLSEQNMIMINKNTILSFFVKTYEQYQLNGNLEVINGDWETIRNFIKLDLGIHMYSSLYAKYKEFQDNDLVLKKVEHLFPNINLYFVSKYNNSLRKPLKKFIEIATEETSKDFSF